MRIFEIWDLTQNRLATPFRFFSREKATHYTTVLKWPYEKSNMVTLVNGELLKLRDWNLKIQSQMLRGLTDSRKNHLYWLQHTELGRAVIIPGETFQLEDWHPVPHEEYANPAIEAELKQIEQKTPRTDWRIKKEGISLPFLFIS